jgi:hypothetical protein
MKIPSSININIVYVIIITLAIFSLLITTNAFAAPMPQEKVVNHKTRECGYVSIGDECEKCQPSDGWEFLYGSCPIGYTENENLVPKKCTFYYSERCCSENHTGSSGDCSGITVNPIFKICSLNGNAGWSIPSLLSKVNPFYNQVCPQGYSWVDINQKAIMIVIIIIIVILITIFVYKWKSLSKGGTKL